MRLLTLLLVMIVCAAGAAVAGPFEDAEAAFVKGDYVTALRLWRPLAEQGNVSAQLKLGSMYSAPGFPGVPEDNAAAASWYRKAAEQGSAKAQHFLGYMYKKGKGVTQDYAAAASWDRKAAEQGYGSAQLSLGRMYDNGQGVPQDRVQAHKWFNLAAASEEARLGELVKLGAEKPLRDEAIMLQGEAIKNRYGVEATMTAAQIADAQKLAREWKPTQPVVTKSAPPPTGNYPIPGTVVGRANPPTPGAAAVPMKKEGGTYVVPVLINNAITLDFIVDSGASDVTIPEDVVSTLIRTGTIRDTDFIGEKTYVLADGSRVKSKTFRIRSLKVGDRILENVAGSVASTKGSLLLGQSFLGRFKSWSIDNSKHVLLLE